MKIFFKTAAAASVLSAALLALCSCNNGNRISGILEDAGNDSLTVSIYDAMTERLAAKDTIVAENGKIDISFKDTAMFIVYIDRLHTNVYHEPIFMMPGDKIEISGTLDHKTCKGSDIYDSLHSNFPDFFSIVKEINSTVRNILAAGDSDEAVQEAMRQNLDSLNARKDSIYAAYIKNNPNDLASGYLTLFLNPEKGLESYNLLGSAVKESALGELLDDMAESFTASIMKERNKANVQPGKPAPEFCLKGIDGKEYTLASFRGKYVLLDFWGSWCYWCMKGMPDMKEYYGKYSDRIEFVGIDCGDSEETWKETVEKEGLGWTNLYNGDGQKTVTDYAIEGFPTKILIDKEGKIVEIFVGESEELYEKLDKLFR